VYSQDIGRHTARTRNELTGLNMTSVVDALVGTGLSMSRSDAQCQVQQGHVKVDGERVLSIEALLPAGAHSLRRGREERILRELRDDPLLTGILEGELRFL